METERIWQWMCNIQKSPLSIEHFFAKHNVPFSIAQYYRYKKQIAQNGKLGLIDNRQQGNHRKLSKEVEGFLKGYLHSHTPTKLAELQEVLHKTYQIHIGKSGLSRCVQRMGCTISQQKKNIQIKRYYTACGGLELIVALANELGWPKEAASVIKEQIDRVMHGKHRKSSTHAEKDRRGRNKKGQFTGSYNKRKDVRSKRFASIEMKRCDKNFESMSIFSAGSDAILRKCVAGLILPVVTNNGAIRSVNGPLGTSLLSLCGFNYRQSTLTKFFAELKYLGISEALLQNQVSFWQRQWRRTERQVQSPVLCYYVDGNTKALWSKKPVKKNKVTMLGRVMGCLEQVFVHDSFGCPIYFETFSGHGPVGEYVLSLFKKIEYSLVHPNTQFHVNRAIVMDGASNSVGTLRAFASQDKYHYITTLDDNQWKPRKIRSEGRVQRYRYGSATLRDCEIELSDSLEKNEYLIVVRAIKIEWDHGKITVVLTSLDSNILTASEVVKAYFDRWPYQELSFKTIKAVAGLHRVAGYGKQKVEDTKVRSRQVALQQKISQLRHELKAVLADIAEQEQTIALLVKRERRLRAKSGIVDGKRVLPPQDLRRLTEIRKEISKRERMIRTIIKPCEKSHRSLRKSEQEWLRLQGKEKVYKVDVELDQIVTSFRVALINICSYLVHDIFKESQISLASLFNNILCLPALVEETQSTKRVTLKYNEKALSIMSMLPPALKRLNKRALKSTNGKYLEFEVGDIDSHLKST